MNKPEEIYKDILWRRVNDSWRCEVGGIICDIEKSTKFSYGYDVYFDMKGGCFKKYFHCKTKKESVYTLRNILSNKTQETSTKDFKGNIMNWEKMLVAMQATGQDINLIMIEPGKWTCSLPGEIGGNDVLRGSFGHGSTPEEAVIDAWGIIENLPCDRYFQIRNKKIRWNGFMWENV